MLTKGLFWFGDTAQAFCQIRGGTFLCDCLTGDLFGRVARASCRTSQLATWHCIKKELGIIGAVADDQRVFLWGNIGKKKSSETEMAVLPGWNQ